MHQKPALYIKDLHVEYWHNNHFQSVLKSISLTLKSGEITTILGESGSGKTTLGKALMGLLPPSAKRVSGKLNLGNNIQLDLKDNAINWTQIRGRKIAMIFQDPMLALNPVMTIRAHFRETMFFHKMASESTVDANSKDLLKSLNFDNPDKILASYPHELSLGMCQRVYIALVICLKPEIIIADEPTSSLDIVSQNEVLNLFKSIIKHFQLSVLLITHNITVAASFSDQIAILRQGEIVEHCRPTVLLENPQHPYTKALVATETSEITGLTTCRCKANDILTVNELTKSYTQLGTRVKVLDALSFNIKAHESIGILGYSGCGKSTLVKCIVGLETADSGSIYYHNQDITHLRGKKRNWVYRRMQMVFQDARASLNPNRSALQLVQEPLKYLKIGDRKARKDKAYHYLKQVGISDEQINQKPPQLSTGQCQRIAIARALVVEPDLLICDESVSALDAILKDQILKLLHKLQQQLGFAIIMISHDIRVIKQCCQMVAVVNCGTIEEFLPVGCPAANYNCETAKLLFEKQELLKAVSL